MIMRRLTAFVRRHTLWVGFLAVLAPLGVLVSLQFVWLSKLSETSAIAHQVALENFLETVGKEVTYHYVSLAERSLNFPASLFIQGRLHKAAYQWGKKPVPGARRLFIVDYTRDPMGTYRFYNRERGILEVSDSDDSVMAIISACVPWQQHSIWSTRPESPGITVDERDPENRIILSPIVDDRSRIMGVIGMVLDEEYFRDELLPDILDVSVSSHFPQQDRGDLVVNVTDGRDNLVLGERVHEGEGETRLRKLPYVFTDWTVSLHSHGSTPEQWARTTFAFNMTLVGLVTLLLLGGIILALRTADRAMKLSEMKSDFVSNVSHELRTPLASVRVFGELLRIGRARDPEKVREYGEYIEMESRRLSRLIDNILDFSRIESGGKTYEFVQANVEDVVESVMQTFRVRVRNAGFEVEYQGPVEPLPTVAIDPDAIRQALNNLLDNAVKYSEDKKEISVQIIRESDAVRIAVRDRGIGIARGEQRKIFDRFHRVGTGLVHDVKGAGLGLSIVHHIVKAHGGKVSVESELGKGSTISIRIPVEAEPSPEFDLGAEGTATS